MENNTPTSSSSNSNKNAVDPIFDSLSTLNPEQVLSHISEIKTKVEDSFPIDVFPAKIKNMINSTNDVFSFPKEYTSGTILYVISVAMGNNFKIVPKEGWIESGALWVALIGKAGAVKSPVLRYVLEPLRILDTAVFDKYTEERKTYESLSKEEQAATDMPIEYSYVVQDVSPEKLMQLHAINQRGIGVVHDELVGLWTVFDRSQGANEGQFLTGWDGAGMKVNRLGRESTYINEMHIPIIGGTQPSKLFSLAKNGRDSSGFMARFLFCFNDDSKKGKWNDRTLSPSHALFWESVVIKIVECSNDTHRLNLSQEAYMLLQEWQHKNASQVDELGEGTLAEIYNKAERNCLRLALNLQILYWACDEGDNEMISVRAIRGAIKLMEYFKLQADKVCHYLYDSSPADRLPKKKKEFYLALPDVFTAREAVEIGAKHKISRSTFYRMATSSKGLFKSTSSGTFMKVA